jgi:hypothetical protein
MSRIDSASPYRVQGTVISIAELAKTKPGLVHAASADQLAQIKPHEEQPEARKAATAHYAAEHSDQIHAQVVFNAKVMAAVYDAGATIAHQNVPGLKLIENGEGMALANAGLDELMQAIPGKVIYDNFVPPLKAPSSNMPESVLPAVAVRGLVDLMRDMGRDLARSRTMLDETPEA